LKPLVGWTRSPDGLSLLCPQQTHLTISLSHPKGRQPRLRFMALESVCSSCPVRSTCIPGSQSTRTTRNLTLLVESSAADVLPELIIEEQQRRRTLRRSPCLASPAPPPESTGRKAAQRPKHYPFVAPQNASPGPYQVMVPLLLVAVLRHSFRDACTQLQVKVDIGTPPQKPRPSPAIAASPAEREHRRQPWVQRHQKNALPPDVPLTITFDHPSGLIDRLAESPPGHANAA
jgi:hypothetical protein